MSISLSSYFFIQKFSIKLSENSPQEVEFYATEEQDLFMEALFYYQ